MTIIIFSVATFASFFIGGVSGLKWATQKKRGSEISKALFDISIGMIILAFAFFLWDIYYHYLGGIPLLSVPDILFLIAPLFLISGLYHFREVYKALIEPTVPTKHTLNIFGILIVCLVLYFGIPMLYAISLDTLFDGYYILTDIILFIQVIMIVRVSGGRVIKGARRILAGIIVASLADIFFIIASADVTYTKGDISDYFFILAGILLSYGIYAIQKQFTFKS